MDRTLPMKLLRNFNKENINDIFKSFLNRFGMCSGCCNKRIEDCHGRTR